MPTVQRRSNKAIETTKTSSTEVSTSEGTKIAEGYLKNYAFCRRLLKMKKYADKYFETYEWESETPAEFSLAKAKMFEIRHFLLDLPECKEKLILYYHFVRMESVEKCAELLGVSRSTGFRLKKRGLELAYTEGKKRGIRFEKF